MTETDTGPGPDGEREAEPSHLVKTARTTIRILEILMEQNGATVTEISDHLDLSTSSIHNYLRTLEHEGYVVRSGDTYDVALSFLNLGGYARDRQRIYEVAKPELRMLAKDTGEVTSLMVEEHGYGYFLYRAQGSRAVPTNTYIGQRVYLHCTAMGKAILAHLPTERVEEILDRRGLPRMTANTITDRDELLLELDRIREAGVAHDREEWIDGIRSTAVPILSTGRVRGSIGISGPASRMSSDHRKTHVAKRLESAASVIEVQL
jgi:DNA-binding IclR family transcriptional regulator